jgi:2-C-methyl-D-erythritol 4-phosphate cytidylyltransferase
MTIALIVAAGRGERLAADRPKALVALAGRPLLDWSIDALKDVAGVDGIVVALPPGTRAPSGLRAVDGGAVRSDSVRRALQAAGEGDPGEAIVVHDAARPLVTAALVERVLTALAADENADAAIAAVPVTDTVKRVRDYEQAARSGHGGGGAGGGEDSGAGAGDERTREGGVVSETLERGRLWAVQTPQVFRRAALEGALDVPAEVLAQATDDAWLIERAGGRVIVVRASEENLKVTTRLDLEVAELLIARRGRHRDARPA